MPSPASSGCSCTLVGTQTPDDDCSSDISQSVFDDLTNANEEIQHLIASGLSPDDFTKVLSSISHVITESESSLSSGGCINSGDGRSMISHLETLIGSLAEATAQESSEDLFGQCPSCLSSFGNVSKSISELLKELDGKLKSNPCSVDCGGVSTLNNYISTLNSFISSLNSKYGANIAKISSISACGSGQRSCSKSTWTTTIPVPCTQTSLLTGTVYTTGKPEAAVRLMQGSNALRARAVPTSAISKSESENSGAVAQSDSGGIAKPMGVFVITGVLVAALV